MGRPRTIVQKHFWGMFVSDTRREQLRRLARALGVSQAECVRRGLDLLEQQTFGKLHPKV